MKAKTGKGLPEEEHSYFDLWADKGAGLKKDLEAVGFRGIKMWEQASNTFYMSGAEYVQDWKDSIDGQCKGLGLSEQETQ